MARVDPLSAAEDAFWRALMRIILTLPRRLDNDLLRATGISANEYMTLMSLSEAPGRELRMTHLANATGLSASRMTRLVEELQSSGLVTKRASGEDGRGKEARLTPAGLGKLKLALGVHVASMRARVFDHVDSATTREAAQALAVIAAHLDDRR